MAPSIDRRHVHLKQLRGDPRKTASVRPISLGTCGQALRTTGRNLIFVSNPNYHALCEAPFSAGSESLLIEDLGDLAVRDLGRQLTDASQRAAGSVRRGIQRGQEPFLKGERYPPGSIQRGQRHSKGSESIQRGQEPFLRGEISAKHEIEQRCVFWDVWEAFLSGTEGRDIRQARESARQEGDKPKGTFLLLRAISAYWVILRSWGLTRRAWLVAAWAEAVL